MAQAQINMCYCTVRNLHLPLPVSLTKEQGIRALHTTCQYSENYTCRDTISKLTSPQVINLFSCSTQMGTIFNLLIKTEIQIKEVSCIKSLRWCSYCAYKCKMPSIVGFLTVMSRIILFSAELSMEKVF